MLPLHQQPVTGGEKEIRTLDAGSPHNSLAPSRFRPLTHLSEIGCEAGHRTQNLPVNSRALCQLSYFAIIHNCTPSSLPVLPRRHI